MKKDTLINDIEGTYNTAAAAICVRNAELEHVDVKEFLKRNYKNYRQNQWKKELRTLADQQGKSVRDICRYIGVPESDAPRFWMRMPKQREYYIGIGMYLGQSLDTINRWIKQYGGLRQLYVKDIKSDLVWIYLINASLKVNDGRNFYEMYDDVCEQVDLAYTRIWNDNEGSMIDTDALFDEYKYLTYDDESIELLRFVEEHFEHFKTAYARPRKMLSDYLGIILDGLNATGKERWTLNSLRGYLDDNMINYLSGNYMCINTINQTDGRITCKMKRVPKSKRAHIELATALGMSLADIDRYLISMGYAQLDPTDQQEGRLINLIMGWEIQHPEQRALIDGRQMNPARMRKGAESMLDMRGYLAYHMREE